MRFLTFILQETPAQQGGGSWSVMIMIVVIFVIMWLFMIRPQQKKQKEMEKFRKELQKGDKVVTVGGIYGVVSEIKENTVDIEVAKDVRLRVDKSSLVKDFSDAQQQ
ncbi:MAG: preprotein translocase subunit YajC [Bacteroidales bacterium]|nr:preprotein translocase subunit YajC [Bacteroidales bacterium]